MAALFQFRDETLTHAMDEVGRIAIGFSQSVNELQQQGLDLNGQVGQDMFRDVNDPAVAAARAILPVGSTAEVKVYIDDLSKVKIGEYGLASMGASTPCIAGRFPTERDPERYSTVVHYGWFSGRNGCTVESGRACCASPDALCCGRNQCQHD